MRRGLACCTLVLAAAAVSTPTSTSTTATAASQTKNQGHLPTLTPRSPWTLENGLNLHPDAAVKIDGRKQHSNERRRGKARARLNSRARPPAGRDQPCFLQPCSSAPVIRERAGRKVGLGTSEKPDRSAIRCRHRVEQPWAKRRR